MEKVKSSSEEKPDEYVELLAAELIIHPEIGHHQPSFSGEQASALPSLFLPALKALLGPTHPPLYQPTPWQAH